MHLSVKQKTNIRHFIYYLVNGTLDFDLIDKRIRINEPYYQKLQSNPSVFFKTCCVFINQEVKMDGDWPQVKRLGQYLCKELDPVNNSDLDEMEDWELDFSTDTKDLAGEFKDFTQWFIETPVVAGIDFSNYIVDGATFVEQCFAIWSNVVVFDNSICINSDHTRSRVSEYIGAYYLGYQDKLEDWECELW